MAGGSAVIGALRVVLGADTAAFESGLKKAQGQATSFAHSVEKIAAGIGLEHGIEKFVEAIVHSFKAAIEHADELGKAAQKVGLPVAELSKLKFAADLSDVSMESLTIGLGKLSKAMLDVARGGGNETKLAFDQLGISATNADGTLKSGSAVLADVAGKFGGLTAPARPTLVSGSVSRPVRKGCRSASIQGGHSARVLHSREQRSARATDQPDRPDRDRSDRSVAGHRGSARAPGR
jgi:hypothetical protein